MKILICDDDSCFTEQLYAYIRRYFTLRKTNDYEIAVFHDGASLLANCEDAALVFLDIEMPGMNGIETGNALKAANPDLILFVITAYSQYLDDALRFCAFRYLSKPLSRQRLYANLDDAMTLYYSRNARVLVETKDRCVSLRTEDIICIEAKDRATVVYTPREDYVSIQKIAFWQQELPKGSFFLSHRSFLVNLAHVTEFDHDAIYLDNGKPPAYLTHRKYVEFKKAYLQYLGSKRSAI